MPYKQYNNNQTALTFPFEMNIPEDHVVRVISLFIDGTNLEEFTAQYRARRGLAAFGPGMMLKMLLFAYTRGATSGHKIQELVQENIPMKWPIGNPDVVPNARTINRLRSAKVIGELIKIAYLRFRLLLANLKLIDDEAIFIDGTKIVAEANNTPSSGAKVLSVTEPVLDAKANALFEELMQTDADIDIKREDDDLLTRMTSVAEQLDAKIARLYQIIKTEKVAVAD